MEIDAVQVCILVPDGEIAISAEGIDKETSVRGKDTLPPDVTALYKVSTLSPKVQSKGLKSTLHRLYLASLKRSGIGFTALALQK